MSWSLFPTLWFPTLQPIQVVEPVRVGMAVLVQEFVSTLEAADEAHRREIPVLFFVLSPVTGYKL